LKTPGSRADGKDGKKLIKGFYNSPDKTTTPVKTPLSPRATKTPVRISSNQYSVQFPKGSMGLELEPVIVSTAREVGCRVRDFYFSDTHEGMSRATLERLVSPGDVITAVNGKSVVSMPFKHILKQVVTPSILLTHDHVTPARH
jgi:hypothetical protein